MEKLIRERKSIDARLQRSKQSTQQFREDIEAEDVDIQSELDNLQEIWATYIHNHKRIVECCPAEDLDDVLAHMASFEGEVLVQKRSLAKMLKRIVVSSPQGGPVQQDGGSAIAALAEQQTQFLRMMASHLQTSSASTTVANSTENSGLGVQSHTDLKLPRITIPHFSGDMLEWQSFIDLFESAVHRNPSLQDSQKLYLLKTNLNGEAASLLSHLRIEDVNYVPALAKLKERYNRPLEIAHQHIARFLHQPTMVSPSASGLRALHDTCDEVVRALQAMQREDRDIWLLHIVTEKLDSETKQLWCQKKAELNHEEVTFDRLLKFIDAQGSALSAAQSSLPVPMPHSKLPQKLLIKRSPAFTTTSSTIKDCLFCQQSSHPLYHCGKFLRLAPSARLTFIRNNKLCENCMRLHTHAPCKSGNCRICNFPHHTSLHLAIIASPVEPSSETTCSNVSQALMLASHQAADVVDSNVLLPTVLVNVSDRFGRSHACRAILDCASHASYATKELCERLSLPTFDLDFEFAGISGSTGRASKGACIAFSSRCSDYKSIAPCVIVDKLTGSLPLKQVDTKKWNIPASITLADPQFDRPGRIQLLLGNKFFFPLLEPGIINLCPNDSLPVLQNTKLGWVVSGGYEAVQQPVTRVSPCFLTVEQDELSAQLRQFWEFEEYINPEKHLSEEEKHCESHFAHHTTRDDSGRFTVRLPFRETPDALGESREYATKRFLQLERKLAKNPHLKEQYHAFMREYCATEHMTKIETPYSVKAVYLPHHCVVKDTSSTTKCRVVFDASAKTDSGKSLNDVLMAGPVLQDSLINILLRFRFPAVALVGDIKMMYRMVNIHKADRDFQRILWRWNEDEPIEEYHLNTITYGTKSASFLATKCVQQVLEQHRQIYPEATEKALQGIYVDDVLTGADSIDGARSLREQLSTIFSSGRFHLRKFASNRLKALEGVDPDDLELKTPFEISDGSTIKTLGIHWQPCSDGFLFRHQPSQILQPTKRNVLSQIASLFDPLGLVAPIIVKAKIVMQKLWELKVAWDSILFGELLIEWQIFAQNLSDINSFQIPRRVIGFDKPSQLYLHGFSDASERAMGACVYVLSLDNVGNVSSHLLCAKSRIAPIGNGRMTLPRLELCAAVMLARLIGHVTKAIKQSFTEIRAWTDSEIVLAWLNGGASRWKTFVANRVAEITTSLPAVNWSHIDTHANPADIISRGAFPEQLKHNALWWHGPEWTPSTELPRWCCSPQQQAHIQREQRLTSVCLIASYENSFLDELMSRYYPDLQTLLRITTRLVRVFRFPKPSTFALAPSEIKEAMLLFVRHVQQKEFLNEWSRLCKGKPVLSSSNLNQLTPFLDETGVIRVGGRLGHSAYDYDVKHPILLPHRSILTSLLLIRDHESHQHCGPQTLLAISRQQFWILRGTSAARKVYRQCIVCARVKPPACSQQMGHLPMERVQLNLPFTITGVDYAGPVSIVGRRARGAVASKGYIALFVCMSSKAVHLEAVSSLHAASFIAAFTRFASRYGLPAKMFSDNATNFRAAAKELREVHRLVYSSEYNTEIANTLANKGVEWSFIPAHSPHHGGLWEASIKVAKQLIAKTTGISSFTFEELSTLLAGVAATMNSRPLCAISSSPDDPQVLTPAHLLIGRPLTTVPSVNLLERQITSLSRWQFIQRLSQDFKARWQKEYVGTLHRLSKWQRSGRNLSPGDLVLLVDDNKVSLQWPLGRVSETFPGSDGQVRVVTVRTLNGLTRRDVRRLRVLPLDEDEFLPRRGREKIP